MKKDKSKILWYNLALLAFTGVWGFGNIINGFSTYGGVRAIIPWLIVLILYFLPYSLMVGELGSAFPEAGAGVGSWVKGTMGATAAYFAGWTYWVVHLPYISQKLSKLVVATGWLVFGDNSAQKLSPALIAVLSLAIFAIAIFLALRGASFLKKIASIAGMASFVMSILYIIMMFSAKAITGSGFGDVSLSFSTYKPEINLQFFLSLSILIFAVGGCEKVSPYVNQMKKPSKDFPLGMIALAIMISVCAILGTVAMGMMFDSNNIPEDLMTNGAYYAFQTLGKHYGLGNAMMYIYAACEIAVTITVIIISIDAPLKILLDNADEKYIPRKLFKRNKNGVYTNGVKMVAVIAGLLILMPAFGIGGMNELVIWLVKINSVCMPLRYLWVFLAYIALKKGLQKNDKTIDYKFVKNNTLGKVLGGWCFLVTAAACIMGIYSEDTFQLVMNIVVPIFLIGLGMIMPLIAKRTNKKELE